ncbi:hypothetical protein JTB14_035408 [Gonioctena quinquepunctata]|nr:hypothetical protein JTB14_035408 [Gonioctena quinquepunctata]
MAGVSKENKAKKSANKRSERKKRKDLKNRLMTSHGRQESEVQDESIWRHINLPEILRQQQMRYNFSELQVAALNYVLTNLLPLLEDTTQGNLPLIYPLPNGSEYREVAVGLEFLKSWKL